MQPKDNRMERSHKNKCEMLAKPTKQCYQLAHRPSQRMTLRASLRRAREALRRKVLRQARRRAAKKRVLFGIKRKPTSGIITNESKLISDQGLANILKGKPLKSSIGKLESNISRTKSSAGTNATGLQRQTNPYFIFLDHYRKFLYKSESSVILQKNLTKHAGEYWRQLNPAAKYMYKQIARKNRVENLRDRNHIKNNCKVSLKLMKFL